MRKPEIRGAWKRAAAIFLLSAGMAGFASPANAGNLFGGCSDSCCEDPCGFSCGEKSCWWDGLFKGCHSGDDCCPDDCCEDPGCGLDDGCGLGGCGGSGVEFGGWVQVGYATEPDGLFISEDEDDKVNFNQIYGYAEKVADGSDGVGFGFRADVLYGTDAYDTQSFGNNEGNFDFANAGLDRGIYAWAFPQLYAEVASGDWSVKIGHFYTLLGYEVVTAPDNFFYSHAFTMYNSEAFTHTGVLSTYSGENVTLYNGYTLGWDTGFDQNDGGSNYLGGFSTSVTDNTTFTYITTFGNFGAIGQGYSHSMVLNVAITDELEYVAQSDLLEADNFETIGLNQYLFYTISDKIRTGSRFEWWKADGDSIYAITYGVNIKPTENLIFRPEYRRQFSPSEGVVEPGGDMEQLFAVDMIYTF